jgi:DNA-binding winged helix-turn-helix (wHTH) protein
MIYRAKEIADILERVWNGDKIERTESLCEIITAIRSD